jgi:hypothetical protein
MAVARVWGILGVLKMKYGSMELGIIHSDYKSLVMYPRQMHKYVNSGIPASRWHRKAVPAFLVNKEMHSS